MDDLLFCKEQRTPIVCISKTAVRELLNRLKVGRC